jgi:molecular chaperone GrpE
MPASDEPGSGPVIHDNRRIDPVTGQARGKHVASKPAGTSGAGRRPEPPDSPGAQAATNDEASNDEDDLEMADTTDEVLEGILEEPASAGAQEAGTQQAGTQQAGAQQAGAQQQLAERTADLQRLQAEYANYRKRVDRDRVAVKEQAVAAVLAGLLPVLDAIDQAREHGELSGGFKSVADSLTSATGKLGLVTYGEKGDPFDPKIHEALTHTYSSDVAEDTCVEILQPGYKVGDRILRPARVAVAEPATGPDGSSNEAAWSSDEEGN